MAISPCPNDTFAFYSLIHSSAFTVDFLDIEELNRALIEKQYAIAKGSFAIMRKLSPQYEILPTGSAIGAGVGPVLVGNIRAGAQIALPGENTTAHKLFQYWQKTELQGCSVNLVQMPFHEMLPALKHGSVDAAVLIHEGRFVYAREGLGLIVDLGAHWENKTGAMVPLGGIYADTSLNPSVRSDFSSALGDSLAYSLREYEARSAVYTGQILPYMQAMAQEKDPQVVEAHVRTYVTSDTASLSPAARKSIDIFAEMCL